MIALYQKDALYRRAFKLDLTGDGLDRPSDAEVVCR
jgi:hypothetical protein